MAFPILIPWAVMLTIGAIAGYAYRDSEGNTQPKSKAISLDEALRLRLRKLGTSLLSERKEAADDKIELSDYIAKTYRGLYCLGRSEAKLSGNSIESYSRELANLHHKLRPQKDKALVTWYQDSGAGHSESFAELLSKCPEVKKLGVDARYIAYAFGEASENLSFKGLTEEFVNGFANKI